MRRVTSILILLVCLAVLKAMPAPAFFFDDNTLVSIDGNNYTTDDFKRWWKFYNDKDRPLPESPDPYIDWLLLAREAKSMDLAETPGFKRQTRIFLQSRTLFMLKYEEVNSRIEVTDDEIRKRYDERYQPRWLVKYLTFKDKEAAAAAWQELDAGMLTVTELSARDTDQGGPVSSGMSWLRPVGIDQKFTAIFQKLGIGEVADPSLYDNVLDLYYLIDQKEGDEEDFAEWREEIKKTLWKEQEDALTQELLAELRRKYQVKVDEERLAALDITAAYDTFTDAPIITTNHQNFSEKHVMAVIRRLMATRAGVAHAGSNDELARTLKNETVNNIIAQSLTNWECLDRHYEEKEPFKWEYEFNYNHRLVTALETRLFAEKAKISEEEIKRHYEENISQYTNPTTVRLYIVDETQGPIDQIWADAAMNKNFQQIMEKHFGLHVKAQEAPANHLDPEVRAVVAKLTDGETSQIFKAQGIRVLVHLIERTPEAPVPLERVKDSIHKNLWKDKLNQMVNEYIDTLKSRSDIKVMERQWKAIKKELAKT
jgi:parvulin-like peptidyl-prolyl isomerase